jgi:hypothetical protein
MLKKCLAALCAVWIAFMPTMCLAQAAIVGSAGSASERGGVRLLGRDGVNDQGILTDNSGRLDPLAGYPTMELIAHMTNRTIAIGLNDSSTVPFSSAGYTQLFALLRIKAASFAATSKLELAARGVAAAQYDSTALGWWYPLGVGTVRKGKHVPLVTLLDRWQMIPLTDSLTSTPFQAPFTGLYLSNLTGAQVIYDLWFLGVR